MIERIKYITNRDLLAEIHNSKNSYCFFEKPEYSRFDAIVETPEDITPEVIEQARAKRAASLSTKTHKVPADSIDPEAVVFRVMSVSHVPLDPTGKRKPRTSGGEGLLRTSFPPFSHYVLRDGVPVEVGRSHWVGSLSNGHFSDSHGAISNRLAAMFMLLVKRYALSGNWRGYCVDTATEALTQRGWLSHDQITEDDVILSYDGGRLAWSRIKSIYRGPYDGKMFHLTVRGMDALVTPGHKFLTQDGLKPAERLLAKDRVILTGAAVAGPETPTHSDAFVELAGWVAARGSIYPEPDRAPPHVNIVLPQGAKAARIRACLAAMDCAFREIPWYSGTTCFEFSQQPATKLAEVIDAEGNGPSMGFVLSLTEPQRDLLVGTMLAAGGKPSVYSHWCERHRDAFVALCTLTGLRIRVKHRDCHLHAAETAHAIAANIDFHGGRRRGANEPTVDYTGTVWCPETEFGSFMCRRNGAAYLTGNTYNDEMRSHALLQLSQTALQFDESKGENPFAWYTTIITNCFRRILLVERRNHAIRDDLLIMAGAAPSFGRQIDHEMEQRRRPDPSEPKAASTAPKKPRGRRPKAKTETNE